MATSRNQIRALGRILRRFALVALIIVVPQLFPVTGEPLSEFFAPGWCGLLFQLLLLTLAILGLLGRVPRWALAIPLAVWIGGAAHWWLESASIRQRLTQAPAALELQAPAEHLVFTSGYQIALAPALVGLYQVDSAYVGPMRYRFATGAACEEKKEPNQPSRLWSPAFLKKGGQCVVQDRASPPAEGYDIFLHPVQADFQTYAIAEQQRARVTEIDIKGRGSAVSFKARLTVRQEYPPLPLFWPLVGCDYSRDERNCFLGILRSLFYVQGNPDHVLTNADWLENNAFYIAHALGLKRRPGIGAEAGVAK